MSLNQYSIVEIENFYRSKHGINREDYPLVKIVGDIFFINQYFKKHEKEIINQVSFVRDVDDKDHDTTFTHKTDTLFVINDIFPMADYGDGKNLGLVFYRTEEEYERDFLSTEQTYYDVGTYFLNYGHEYFLKKVDVRDEQVPLLNEDIFEILNKDINTFFSKKEVYKQHNLAFKRGVLLYGEPGTGKTSSIRYFLKSHPDKYGVIFNCNNHISRRIATFMNKVLHGKDIIFVLEDIDSIEAMERTELLNLLDGVETLQNCFIIATTNHVHKLDTALVDRPSRFDRLFYIGLPDAKTREKLLLRYFPTLTRDDLERFVKLTEGFSGAYFKELYILYTIQDSSIDDAIKSIKKQVSIFKEPETQNYMG